MCSKRLTRSVLGSSTSGVLWIFLLLSPAEVWPWGCDGHQAMAMIAERHLNGHAREMANQLLKSAPIDPALRRFCSGRGLDPFTDVSTWADDERSVRPETGPWHYIDIPRGAPRRAVADSCPSATGCVTSTINHQLELLRNGATDARTRADALRYVIHFVGDLHQPLHCTTNNDMGGNCVPIVFFGVHTRSGECVNVHVIEGGLLLRRQNGRIGRGVILYNVELNL